ncbi:MAG: MFS transporter [Pelistega sp.]|nr:MFS transporter [Pelistega sp.]
MNSRIALRVFFLFALGYFLSNLFRGLNVGFAPYLIQEMNLSAGDLGLLTSFYFIGFAVFQLPAGLALDRWGARRTHAALLLVAALGGVVYAFSQDIYGLIAGRFLIGMGIAVGYAGALMILSQTSPMSRLPMLAGLIVAAGGMGGVMVGTPLNLSLQYFDWPTITLMVSGVTALLALSIFFTLPEVHPKSEHHTSFKEQYGGIKKIFKTRAFWRLVSLPSATGGVFYAAQSLWVRPYMADVLGYSVEQMANMVSLLGLAMVAGTTLTGLAARKIEAYGINLHLFSGIGFLCFMLMQLLIILQVSLPAWVLWVGFGFSGLSWTLAFAYSAEIFPRHIMGRVTTSFNTIFFACIFTTQIAIGYILDFWPKVSETAYPAQAHITAWSIFLGIQVVAAIIYLWPKPLVVKAEDFT